MKTDKELLELLTNWESSYKRLNDSHNALEKALGCDLIESNIYESAYKLFEQYTNILAELFAKEFEEYAGERNNQKGVLDWLEWYVYENDMGEKQLEAKACSWKRMRKIKDLKMLLKVIMEK